MLLVLLPPGNTPAYLAEDAAMSLLSDLATM